MTSEVGFEVHGLQDFRRVARVLLREDRQLPKKIQKTINREAKVVRKEAVAKIRHMPVEGYEGHTGLRKRVGEGVHITPIEGGVIIGTSMREENETYLPRGLDSRKGWKHPVFGNYDNWVKQYGEYSWFTETMQEAQLPIALGIHQHVQDAIDEIDQAATG